MFTKMGFGSNLSMLTSSTILLGRQYCILYGPNHYFLNYLMCSFMPFRNQIIMFPIKKILILWFCWAHDIVFHCLIHVRFVALWWVSPKCSNSTMWLVRTWVRESFDQHVDYLWVINILLALKIKSHQLVEMVYV
jgi:hypothetical protein